MMMVMKEEKLLLKIVEVLVVMVGVVRREVVRAWRGQQGGERGQGRGEEGGEQRRLGVGVVQEGRWRWWRLL